jgi:hypothetical protein
VSMPVFSMSDISVFDVFIFRAIRTLERRKGKVQRYFTFLYFEHIISYIASTLLPVTIHSPIFFQSPYHPTVIAAKHFSSGRDAELIKASLGKDVHGCVLLLFICLPVAFFLHCLAID